MGHTAQHVKAETSQAAQPNTQEFVNISLLHIAAATSRE